MGILFGRSYKPVESYRTKGAETLLLTMGSITETAMMAVDAPREKGQKGWVYSTSGSGDPFPLRNSIKPSAGAKVLAVVDRALTPGWHGRTGRSGN